MTTTQGMESFVERRKCSTVTLHPQMSPWLDPSNVLLWSEQKRLTWWKHYVRKVGEREALRQ